VQLKICKARIFLFRLYGFIFNATAECKKARKDTSIAKYI